MKQLFSIKEMEAALRPEPEIHIFIVIGLFEWGESYCYKFIDKFITEEAAESFIQGQLKIRKTIKKYKIYQLK